MCSLNNHASQLAHNPACRCSFKSAIFFPIASFFPRGKPSSHALCTLTRINVRHNCFAEWFNHSIKLRKHSTNSLSNVTLGKEFSANCTSVKLFLSSIHYRTLDKDFIERRYLVLDKEKSSTLRQIAYRAFIECSRVLGKNSLFMECLLD